MNNCKTEEILQIIMKDMKYIISNRTDLFLHMLKLPLTDFSTDEDESLDTWNLHQFYYSFHLFHFYSSTFSITQFVPAIFVCITNESNFSFKQSMLQVLRNMMMSCLFSIECCNYVYFIYFH